MIVEYVGELQAGLAGWTWEKVALYRNAYKGSDRVAISGIILEPELKLAVATNGHCLFASRNAWAVGPTAEKRMTVEKKAWFTRGLAQSLETTPPDWQQILPDRYDVHVRFEIPLALENLCRVEDYRMLLSPERVVVGEPIAVKRAWEAMGDEDRARARVLNCDLICNLAGKHVNALWRLPDDPAASGTAVVLVEDFGRAFEPRHAEREQLLRGEWAWFSVVMPMRPEHMG